MTTAPAPDGAPVGLPGVRAAVLVSLLATAVAAVLGGLLSGSAGALGGLVGGAVALGFFSFGSAVLGVVARSMPQAALLVALLTYTLQVAAVGLFFVALTRAGATDRALDARWLAGAVVAVTVAWLAGLLAGALRTRVPVYDVALPEAALRAEEAAR